VVSSVGPDFFARPAREVAPDLIGCELRFDGVAARIVEVERYEQWDAASHSFRGPRGRATTMFGPPGHLYVYRSYGIHWCLNLVCDVEGVGSAVLLRAAEPVGGLTRMAARRPGARERDLCRGPGRLAAAFGITGALDGAPVGRRSGVELAAPDQPVGAVVRSTRIGISRDVERRWRYSLAGSQWVSGPRMNVPPIEEVRAA
jgi:DNA-3-methyladenine glycosylase